MRKLPDDSIGEPRRGGIGPGGMITGLTIRSLAITMRYVLPLQSKSGRILLFVGISCLALVTILGACSNNSRYGTTYDRRLFQIQRVDIHPLNVDILTWHAGGNLEDRPDFEAEIEPKLLQEIANVIQERNRSAGSVSSSDQEESAVAPVGQSLALAHAIEQSIIVHHYRHGKDRIFDYTIGDTVQELPWAGGDAMLLVRFIGVVPTADRVGLAVTSAIVGGLTGSVVAVPTRHAELTLMLVDAGTGDVLWYNTVARGIDVQNGRSLHNLVKDAMKYMLEPRKK